MTTVFLLGASGWKKFGAKHGLASGYFISVLSYG